MYSLSVSREFIARHFLIGGDWGAENQCHAHPYRVEVLIQSEHLDQHGYLLDIVDLERELDKVVAQFRDSVLNEQPEFAGLNPSLEHFSRILTEKLLENLDYSQHLSIEIKLWENASCWAGYRRDLPSLQV
jgi:6-pyruvoyltetrahydropterin/6-carboxytetrahydropterin synthase